MSDRLVLVQFFDATEFHDARSKPLDEVLLNHVPRVGESCVLRRTTDARKVRLVLWLMRDMGGGDWSQCAKIFL